MPFFRNSSVQRATSSGVHLRLAHFVAPVGLLADPVQRGDGVLQLRMGLGLGGQRFLHLAQEAVIAGDPGPDVADERDDLVEVLADLLLLGHLRALRVDGQQPVLGPAGRVALV
jgi:hypothetical protein